MANYPTRKPKPVPQVADLTDAQCARRSELLDKSFFWHLHEFTESDKIELEALQAQSERAHDYRAYLSRLRRWNEAHPSTLCSQCSPQGKGVEQ